MTQRLKGKSAVVTGGGDGIGRGVVLDLAAEGANVVVNDIGCDPDNNKYADKVVKEVLEADGTAVANYDSVATMQGGENIIKTAISNFGRIDILINCAGNFWHRPSLEVTEDEWDSIMAVHLKGHFSCSKAALSEMVKQKNGRIINISSGAAAFGASNPAYATAKAGIIGLTTTMSAEFMEFGVTVNAVLPSASTKMFPGPLGKFKKSKIGFKTDYMPRAHIREPEYIAPIIVYLATDEAKEISGRFFYTSGGDLCIYASPFLLPGGAHVFTRKMGKWTIEELSEVIPPLLGLSQ